MRDVEHTIGAFAKLTKPYSRPKFDLLLGFDFNSEFVPQRFQCDSHVFVDQDFAPTISKLTAIQCLFAEVSDRQPLLDKRQSDRPHKTPSVSKRQNGQLRRMDSA
jgi:hypothetical protein